MLILGRVKTTAVFVALTVLLIGVTVTLVLANRDSDYGYAGENEDVYWDAFVANVKYDDGRRTPPIAITVFMSKTAARKMSQSIMSLPIVL